jgi:ketosteroid isomerase-like protein
MPRAEQNEALAQKSLAAMEQREEPEKIGSERTTTMKTPTELLRAYLAEIQDPAAAAALFADDGVVELPAIHARVEGPAAIEKFIADLLEKVPDFRFQNIRIWIETADQAFGEYDVEALVPATGKVYEQSYAGRLVAEDGKIKLLREWLDPVAASRAFASD